MSRKIMKKILLITRPIAPPWDEASKNFAYSLAKNIEKDGIELHLMTKGILKELPPEIIQEDIYTHSENDFALPQKLRSLFFQIMNRKKFDVAHYFFTPTKLNSFVIKNLIKNKQLKSIQTVATLREDLLSVETIKELMFSDHIVTYSDYAKNKLNSLGFINVSRIYPGIDLEQYKNKPKNEELMKIFSFSHDDFVIHFSGEYVRLAAMDDVIDSFINVSRQIPNAKLFLAVRVKNEKDARKKEAVVFKLKQYGLLENTSFFDNGKYDMPDIYNLADISLFPVQNMHGKFDVPLVVIEAMACEKPIIISDIPILKEFSNAQNSIQIQTGNIEQLSSAILDLYNNKHKREALGLSSRKYVEENFEIRKICQEYKDIYNKL
ncbi:MAG: glycosyltransferase [uncultured bacterium]|nr:MAG: glycosyltransferase [uncultured bacterium]